MGCPPDPVEVSIWRSGERIAALQEKYHRLIDEYAAAVERAGRIIPGFKAALPALAKEYFTRRTDVAPTDSEPYADEAAQSQLERGYAERVKALETDLCILRTHILHAAKTAGPLSAAEIAAERKLHLAHRHEDREKWLAWLHDKIHTLDFLLGDEIDESGHFDRMRALQMIDDIRIEIRRVQSLSDEILLTDRDVLRADERLWRTPYKEE